MVNYLKTILSSSKIKIAANFNEHARNHGDTGMDKGSPDLRFERKINGTTQILYLELKTKKGKLSKPQIAWNKDFNENFASSNCKRAVAYGYSEAIKIIDNWVG